MEYQLTFIGIGLLTFCLGLYRIANGKLKDKVDRTACHTAQQGIKDTICSSEKHMKDRINSFERNISERIQDLKDTVIENGK